MLAYTLTLRLTQVLTLIALACATPWVPRDGNETRTGLIRGQYLVRAEVVSVKGVPRQRYVITENLPSANYAITWHEYQAVLRVTHTYASPDRQIHGTFRVVSLDRLDDPNGGKHQDWSLVRPRLRLGEIGLWHVMIDKGQIQYGGSQFRAFPARKGISDCHAQAVALADVVERADCIESDAGWIAYLKKNVTHDNWLIAEWAGTILANTGRWDKSLQPFLVAQCSRGRHVTSQVPMDKALSHPWVMGDKWRSSPARFEMIKRWFVSPLSDVELDPLDEFLQGLMQERAESGISRQQLREILRAARAKGIVTKRREILIPVWLALALDWFPDDAPLLCMTLEEIEGSNDVDSRQSLAMVVKPRISGKPETIKAILDFDRTMTEQRIRKILDSTQVFLPDLE
jgi:hypothetical protein